MKSNGVKLFIFIFSFSFFYSVFSAASLRCEDFFSDIAKPVVLTDFAFMRSEPEVFFQKNFAKNLRSVLPPQSQVEFEKSITEITNHLLKSVPLIRRLGASGFRSQDADYTIVRFRFQDWPLYFYSQYEPGASSFNDGSAVDSGMGFIRFGVWKEHAEVKNLNKGLVFIEKDSLAHLVGRGEYVKKADLKFLIRSFPGLPQISLESPQLVALADLDHRLIFRYWEQVKMRREGAPPEIQRRLESVSPPARYLITGDVINKLNGKHNVSLLDVDWVFSKWNGEVVRDLTSRERENDNRFWFLVSVRGRFMRLIVKKRPNRSGVFLLTAYYLDQYPETQDHYLRTYREQPKFKIHWGLDMP